MIPAFAFLTLSFAGLSAIGFSLSGRSALVPVVAAIVITGCVGLLSSTAIAADAGRGTEDRADRAVAQCLVYVPVFLARRDARVARSHARARHDTRPHRRAL